MGNNNWLSPFAAVANYLPFLWQIIKLLLLSCKTVKIIIKVLNKLERELQISKQHLISQREN